MTTLFRRLWWSINLCVGALLWLFVFAACSDVWAASSGTPVSRLQPGYFCGRRHDAHHKHDTRTTDNATIHVHVIVHSHIDAGWKYPVGVYERVGGVILQEVLTALPTRTTRQRQNKSQDADDDLVHAFRRHRTFTWGDAFALVRFLDNNGGHITCLLYTSPSPRDRG